ncbi:MAG: molybdate ABC transporter substrate-binding protein [Yaniella sp.]
MRRRFVATLILAALALGGCSSSTDSAGGPEGSLTVLAAASLQQAFDDIAAGFTAKHPGMSVDFNYAGSSTLVQNLDAGAPADVFASADEANMDTAQDAGLIDEPTRDVFAANTLVGIVPLDNPANIATLEDANAAGVNLVVCAPQVPCGALSQSIAEAAGSTLNPVSEEQQVSDVLGKVRSGQADAGLVYATDAALAPDEVSTFELEGADDQHNSYPIARTANAEDPEAAAAFIDYVQSHAGQAILEDHGFVVPQER